MAAANRSRREDEEVITESRSPKGTASKKTASTGSGKAKSTASRKTVSSASKKAATRNAVSKTEPDTDDKAMEDSSLGIEIALMAVIVVSVLMILGFFGIGGVVGVFFGKIVGVFGILGYLFPFVLFVGVAFGAVNHNNKVAGRKLYGGIGLYFALCSIIQLITYGGGSGLKVSAYLMQSWKNKDGGGFVGALIVKGLYSVLGTVGAYVVLIAVILALLMLITEKFLFAFLGKKGKESYEVFVEKQEERRQEKLKKKAVTFNIIAPSTSVKTDVKNSFEKRKREEKRKEEKEKGEKTKSGGLDFFTIDRGQSSKEPLHGNTKKEPPVYQQELENKFKDTIDRDSDWSIEEDMESDNLPSSLDLDLGVLDELISENSGETPVYEEGDSFGTEEVNESMPVSSENSAENEDSIKESAAPIVQGSAGSQNSQGSQGTQSSQGNQSTQSNQSNPSSQSDQSTQSNLKPKKEKKPYVFPPVDLLKKSKASAGSSDRVLKETALKLRSTLESFGVKASIKSVSCGPTVTRYEIQPEQGVKVSRITGLTDDIKLNLAASEIRIEAPIPGKAAVGIEIPNKKVEPVNFRDLIESPEFKKSKSKVSFAVGKDIGNQTIVTDISKMPHVLIAGATGAGKSVCINTLIMSIIYKAEPDDVKLILIDPKVVELSIYNGIPHLLVPVVTDCKKALGALNWAVTEMTDRYQKFSELTVRDLEGYNKKIGNAEYKDKGLEKLPQIVVIVDEMADLMMVAQGEVEGAIVRLTQLARAAGIHLVIATQRPSVNVITGLIKANIPSRIAFSVSSQVDSRTILDGSGAEHLLGKGDMLFAPRDLPKPIRVQGAFISDDEVNDVVEFLKKQNEEIVYDTAITEKIEAAVLEEKEEKQQEAEEADGKDSYFEEAGRLIITKNKASIGLLQRALKIGFNRAARIMDQLCEYGVVGQEQGTKPREILMSMERFEELLKS